MCSHHLYCVANWSLLSWSLVRSVFYFISSDGATYFHLDMWWVLIQSALCGRRQPCWSLGVSSEEEERGWGGRSVAREPSHQMFLMKQTHSVWSQSITVIMVNECDHGRSVWPQLINQCDHYQSAWSLNRSVVATFTPLGLHGSVLDKYIYEL